MSLFLRPRNFLLLTILLFQYRDSFSQFVISSKRLPVITCNGNADAFYAASMFQKYTEEATGKRSSLILNKTSRRSVNFVTDQGLHPDGFRITVSGEGIEIAGGEHRGSTYAVNHFFEKYFNFRYLAPNHRSFPKTDRVEVPCGVISDQPVNDVRIINLYYGNDNEFRDWMRLDDIDEIYPQNYFVHTFNRLLPWEKYFSVHPEYFALVNGKRSIDQICPSDPEVRNLITRKLEAEMALNRGKNKWSVSQNDNFSYCRCDKCTAIIEEEGSPSGPIIHLVNDIANRFPDKIISTLAYQYSRKAPAKVKPAKNVEVMLCTIELHRHLSIDQNPDCADFKKDMEDWGKICSNIFLWDYTINFNHSISPFPNLHILQPNIRFFTKNNVNALFEQSNSATGYEFSELKVYLLSKLMWNPDLDVEREKAEFLKAYYGNAAPLINSYISEMENYVLQNETKLWIYEHPVVHQNGLFSKSNITNWNNLFDQAENAVKSDSVSLNNVRMARLPLQYAEMEIAANNMFSTRGWYLIVDGKALKNERMFEKLERFEETCLKNKVKTINESELSPENYILGLRKMTDVKIEGNLAFGKKVTASVQPDEKYQEGSLSYLTNGVNGASDYTIHWLGWYGKDTELILDLEALETTNEISLNSLWNAKSWILHPGMISCGISTDGQNYEQLGEKKTEGSQRKEDPVHSYSFPTNGREFRYVKITVKGFGKLPDWHPSAGESSWFFLDEITVR